MELNEVIDKRRSIRKYINKKISKEVVECLIDNARLAPSAKNRQPWNFVVVQDTIKNKIADMMIKKKMSYCKQQIEKVALLLILLI